MTAAVRPTVLTGTVETHTPLVNDREPVGLARGREPAGLVRQTRLGTVASEQTRLGTVASDRTRLGTVASDRILLPVRLADAARTARPRGRPAADPGKDHRHAKEGVTAHRGPPEAATAAGRKGLAEAARRNGRLAGGQGAVPGFRRLVAR